MEAQKAGKPVLFLDAGANIGLVTIGLLRRAPFRALALEPDGAAHALLVANMKTQGLSGRVRVLRVAAGAPKHPGRYVLLQRHPGNGGDIRVSDETLDSSEAPLVGLDALLEDEDSQLLLKIDVQGYEPEVVAGALQSLARARLAVVEFWPYGLRCRGHDPLGFACKLLALAASVALIEDEHCCQQPVWIDREEALSRLRQFTNDKAEPDHQLEILMRPSE
ncbi:FkbM family methyltransferase [Fodinicurvata halophila]|uniref:FkbM family methyltransferase n=1 Tax=Fodinicurvata halophila TaxID=1419723 RepID=A0ABV8UI87_9PROT